MQTMLHAIPPPSWTQFKKSELFSRVRCCNKVVSDAHFIVPPSSPATLKPEGESTRSDDGTHHFGTRFSSRLLNGRVMRRKEILAGAAAAEIYYVGGSAPIFPGSLAGVPALEHKLRWCMTSAHARLGRSAIPHRASYPRQTRMASAIGAALRCRACTRAALPCQVRLASTQASRRAELVDKFNSCKCISADRRPTS